MKTIQRCNQLCGLATHNLGYLIWRRIRRKFPVHIRAERIQFQIRHYLLNYQNNFSVLTRTFYNCLSVCISNWHTTVVLLTKTLSVVSKPFSLEMAARSETETSDNNIRQLSNYWTLRPYSQGINFNNYMSDSLHGVCVTITSQHTKGFS